VICTIVPRALSDPQLLTFPSCSENRDLWFLTLVRKFLGDSQSILPRVTDSRTRLACILHAPNHMCKCRVSFLNADWTQKLYINPSSFP
jgi:hypothetical protein